MTPAKARKQTSPVAAAPRERDDSGAPSPSHELTAARRKIAPEIAALVHLADLDVSLLGREGERRPAAREDVAGQRRALGARLSPEVLEAYERAMRGGRRPAVVRLVASVCSGCHVRLHSTLEQRIARRRGVAPCPHCLRLVYDPAWLPA